MRKTHPFEPIYNASSTILILGSLPSVESVKQGFYYMHPQNRFWKMLSKIFQIDLYHATILEKTEFLLKSNLALYDVIESCEIKESSDASIKNASCTDIAHILQKSRIQKILLNGKTAYQLFIKAYPEYEKIAVCMPSTSSANARTSLEELIETWEKEF